MAFNADTKQEITRYVTAHIGDEAWHRAYFDFIGDQSLAQRLGEEFISTRFMYKMLEGVEADGWLLRAQIRVQILSYASIYEAVLHHALFETFHGNPAVTALTEFPTKKRISIPAASIAVLQQHLQHDGKAIIPTYEAVGKTDESKVRFDSKAACACSLGLVEEWLRDELIEFYEARNTIHIHAEIRKSMQYQLDLSRRAYMRMQPFKEQFVVGLGRHGLTIASSRPAAPPAQPAA